MQEAATSLLQEAHNLLCSEQLATEYALPQLLALIRTKLAQGERLLQVWQSAEIRAPFASASKFESF